MDSFGRFDIQSSADEGVEKMVTESGVNFVLSSGQVPKVPEI